MAAAKALADSKPLASSAKMSTPSQVKYQVTPVVIPWNVLPHWMVRTKASWIIKDTIKWQDDISCKEQKGSCMFLSN